MKKEVIKKGNLIITKFPELKVNETLIIDGIYMDQPIEIPFLKDE